SRSGRTRRRRGLRDDRRPTGTPALWESVVGLDADRCSPRPHRDLMRIGPTPVHGSFHFHHENALAYSRSRMCHLTSLRLVEVGESGSDLVGVGIAEARATGKVEVVEDV